MAVAGGPKNTLLIVRTIYTSSAADFFPDLGTRDVGSKKGIRLDLHVSLIFVT